MKKRNKTKQKAKNKVERSTPKGAFHLVLVMLVSHSSLFNIW